MNMRTNCFDSSHVDKYKLLIPRISFRRCLVFISWFYIPIFVLSNYQSFLSPWTRNHSCLCVKYLQIPPPYLEVPLRGFCEILVLMCLGPKVSLHRQWWNGPSHDWERSQQDGEGVLESMVALCRARIESDGPARRIVVVGVSILTRERI